MPASPLQITRYGHIGTAIREAMAEAGLSTKMVAKAINVTPSAVYGWCAAKNAPNDLYRPTLAKLLGLPEASLTPKENREITLPSKAVKPTPRALAIIPAKSVDPLSFTINSSGECRIKLDITLPLDQGTPLLRMLLDANILRSNQNA